MGERARDLRRNVLHERAAACDVEHLNPAADREDRQLPRASGGDERDLELVAPLFSLVDRRVRGLAISRRRDVGAAGQ